jgi:CheY-like chemotaxis protein
MKLIFITIASILQVLSTIIRPQRKRHLVAELIALRVQLIAVQRRQVVKEHQGRVWCTSDSNWTSFLIEVPASNLLEDDTSVILSRKLLGTSFPDQSEPIRKIQRHIIVDDDEFFQKSLELQLKILGGDQIEILKAGAPKHALEMARNHALDFIWLDVDLGSSELDGHGVLREMRRAGIRSKVCINTNSSDPNLRKVSMDLGGDYHLIKPLSQNEIRPIAFDQM